MQDRDILRKLAGAVAEAAALPCQKETAQLYRDVNGLELVRPPVLLDELPWNQLEASGELDLACQDPLAREAEQWLRRTLYRWRHCRGDLLLLPYYPLHRCIHIGDMGVQVVEDTLEADKGNNIISHHYSDQLSDFASLAKLHVPSVRVDDALTQRQAEQLGAAFGDLLPVRLVGLDYAGNHTPLDDLSRWRGVEPILTDLIDNPELLHAFMQRYLDIKLELLAKLESMGLVDACGATIHCTPGLAPELPEEQRGGGYTRKDIWGRCTAQIFAVVSPAMHDEFEIEYAKQYLEGFGLSYYGCCEPLHNKIHILRKLPKLRKVSITPWADVRVAAENIGGDYVLSRKPNPAAVAVDQVDEEALRAEILETLQVCRENNTPCEFILKDISSVSHRPQNLDTWERIVMETVRNF